MAPGAGREPFEHENAVALPHAWTALLWPFAPAATMRATAAWVPMRLFLYLGAGRPSTEPLIITATLLWLIAFAATAALIEARRRHELLFLANCGVGPGFVAAFAVATVLALELLLALVLR